VRLSPARVHEIATDYACRRQAFGKPPVEPEGVGFMLADNLIDASRLG
jgi:acyl-CoA dehydrogenase